jgi:hypothetical protein
MQKECGKTEINDIRLAPEFKSKTFSEFKKTDVKKELLKNLMQGSIEQSCYWSAELICAGHYCDLWDTIILFYTKHVHLGGPKIAIYLDKRVKNFREIVTTGYLEDELRMRNCDKIRRLFCEIICILCEAKRMHSYDDTKIRAEDFDLVHLSDKLNAPSVAFVEEVFKPNDPKELYVALNEFAYNLSESAKNSINACFWVEWVLEFEKKCKVNKQYIQCERRSFADVNIAQQMDVVWLLWDVLLSYSTKHIKSVQTAVQSLLNLFTMKYTTSCCKKRKYIIFFAVSLLTEQSVAGAFNIELTKNKEKVAAIVDNIDTIYKQIKQNERSPNTDYLFTGLGKSNLDKTIEKLEIMNGLNADFIPRVE